jgi:hypothetical protein
VALFGGALKLDLPTSFRSMEDLIPVPDTQEIFQDMTKEGTNYGQLIVEILERTEKADSEAIEFNF